MFGVVFPNLSYPLDATSFTQIDPTHWIMDLAAETRPHQICLFLLNPASLPPDKALSVYFQPPSSSATSPSSFAFCGHVSLSRPSAVLPLPWPDSDDVAAVPAKIGISVEDLVAVPALDAAAEKRAEKVAMKVGENLFNFMQSFCAVDGSRLVVPMDIMDRWFKKFQERARRDPNYLASFHL